MAYAMDILYSMFKGERLLIISLLKSIALVCPKSTVYF